MKEATIGTLKFFKHLKVTLFDEEVYAGQNVTWV